MTIAVCMECNKNFIKNKHHQNQLFCCRKCTRKHYHKTHPKIKKGNKPKQCPICKKEFTPIGHAQNHIFCSIKCREKNRIISGKYLKSLELKNLIHEERKQELVNLGGGKCSNQNCPVPNGYNRCLSALDLHHTKPDEKEENNNLHLKKKFEKIKEQIIKKEIIILCTICHRELHWNLRQSSKLSNV